MARPKGLRLNSAALDDLLAAKCMSLTEAATCSGVAVSTLSELRSGASGASPATIRKLAAGIGCRTETLFPSLLGRDEEAAA